MLQKSSWDFMNPIQIQLTYDLTNVGAPSMAPGTRLPDIDRYPIVNKEKAEKNFSVSTAVAVSCHFHEGVKASKEYNYDE